MSKLVVGAGAWPPCGQEKRSLFKHGCWVCVAKSCALAVTQTNAFMPAHCVLTLVSPVCMSKGFGMRSRWSPMDPSSFGPLYARIGDTVSICFFHVAGFFRGLRTPVPCAHLLLPGPTGLTLCCKSPAASKAWSNAQFVCRGACCTPWRACRIAPSPRRPDGRASCKKAFGTLAAWAAHAAQKHGYRAERTRLATGSTCCGRGRVYAKASRLKRHLDHSFACRNSCGSFQPLGKEDDHSSHPQIPPADAEGCFVDAPSQSVMLADRARLLAAFSDLHCGTALEVLEVVSGFILP